MTDAFRFVDNTTQLSADNLNYVLDKGKTNLVKNSAFLSWLQGTSVAPDGFSWDDGDGTIARESTQHFFGNYCTKVSKATGDSAASYLYCECFPIIKGLAKSNWFTVSLYVKTSEANMVRVGLNDGVSTTMSDYASTGSDFTRISVSKQFSASATRCQGIIECAIPSSATADAYVDALQIEMGAALTPYSPNATDYAMFAAGYEDTSAYTHCQGGIRVIPFKTSWACTSTNTVESGTYTYDQTSPDNRPGTTWAVLAMCYSAGTGGPAPQDVVVTAHTLASNGFNLKLRAIDGTNFGAAGTIQVRGIAIGFGWYDYLSVWGAS